MSQFFSAISNGRGKVLFFKIEDIVKEMVKGNPKNYDWNSHTSLADFFGIKGREEDKWNKWEYDPYKKELKADILNIIDDSKEVKQVLGKYFEKIKNLDYLRNLYNRNSGDRNSGYGNSGNGNSGYWNSGNENSGDGNNGYWNSGNGNSGNRNSGYGNSGNENSGDRNSGYGNSGNGNSGYWNSGHWNSGCIIGHFSSIKQFFLFNKCCTEEEANEVYKLELWKYFNLTEWIDINKMTEEEKKTNPDYQVMGGYLKRYSYKEAWAKVPKEIIEKIKQLKNFDSIVFEEITGIKNA